MDKGGQRADPRGSLCDSPATLSSRTTSPLPLSPSRPPSFPFIFFMVHSLLLPCLFHRLSFSFLCHFPSPLPRFSFILRCWSFLFLFLLCLIFPRIFHFTLVFPILFSVSYHLSFPHSSFFPVISPSSLLFLGHFPFPRAPLILSSPLFHVIFPSPPQPVLLPLILSPSPASPSASLPHPRRRLVIPWPFIPVLSAGAETGFQSLSS